MDTKLRELERAAAGGDAEAEKRLLIEKMRVGNYYPIIIQFKYMYGIPSGKVQWLMEAGQSGPGSPYIGSVMASDSILRGITVSVDTKAKRDYRFQVVKLDDVKDGFFEDKTRGSLLLKAGEKRAGCRDLMVRVPRLVPIGVAARWERDQENTRGVVDIQWWEPGGIDRNCQVSAIYVNLEIWIPG